ncbi:phosphatidylethanolamine N-methyltransferase [Aspergillus clavatus NRRL 1]|uniref:Phosphatidylethanolamine N-methyltransferase n=1 Tax=Aspergillus clavatus (strain ATCC 1007 / CBS 513.65 / DSM 816 / NCTC 3887 / NRRL 1 / QM 1276 / 107) TaxID=344612 RepID=CHO2_ASPCL|nr:phosphatidylethanolamine methyltransferase [Aspergillus clavatus NRRL 1]A1C7T5.1 RecName: Full=Phosphatidylethanolamine N-methyltransferase; Short=PE methyltransferase; Short=PEAMT; Short=PEMT [Aspergillus clavatus NRRL 1]EAW14456.1 phosphatidylethanolamine methyltransferase [Aspergillus clavatus NRRL 1]
MDRGLSTGTHQEDDGLRERIVASQSGAALTPEALTATGEGLLKDKTGKEMKTYGRTPGGTVFTVPQTHDMVSQLLSPSEPKNLSDVAVIAILGVHILLLWGLPAGAKVPVFALIYLFWRAAYNAGIGWLLHNQSNYNTLVRWAEKTKIFVNPATGKNPHPNLYQLIKRELETKIPTDYSFENAPIEYNTWLVFRRLVDLILMCDFVSYCLFAVACSGRPVDEGALMTVLRWSAGIVLVLFNLWVKLDAHRVVKDYAWYWGDFFFLIDQELTFDGVFEMAPHPMYSVGYAGYYGISLMAASYKVLFISILAHAAQFAFLVFVENPHIDKTYNPPPPRKRTIDQESVSAASQASSSPIAPASLDEQLPHAPSYASGPPPSVHNLLGIQNLDLHRITDTSSMLIQFLVFAITVLTPSTPWYRFLFVANAAIWRIWYSVGIGLVLDRQSNRKAWTRHFVKYGETPQEAWNQWKGTYHLSMVMCYASFIAAVWKMYTFPADWGYGLVLLRHVLGAGLISLQIWTSVSIYESLGEFGWFYGDFFFDASPKLTYNGIYRFLNNPERVLGLAGVWGAVLITSSGAITFLALLSHTLTLAFIQFVERPHMQKLYGRSLRRDAGLTKSLKRSLPDPLKQLHGSVDKMFDDSFEFIEDLIDTARPKLAAGVNTFVKDTSALFQKYPARVTISRIDEDLAGYDSRDYSLEVEGTDSLSLHDVDQSSGREGLNARMPLDRRGDLKNLVFEYGSPIKVKWTAPLNHSKKDWIGLYRVIDNTSREISRVSSQGRWIATNEGSYDNSKCEQGIVTSDVVIPASQRKDGEGRDLASGEVVFSGDKLFWTQGVFEFRYHHNGKHNVMSISRPFEIRISRFDEDEIPLMDPTSVEMSLFPVVRNCFDRDPEIAPETVDEPFGSLVERDGKYAKRVVFAVHQMFGIEFAPEVVKADGSVHNLAWRICNAKRVLAPYSMPKNGAATPTEAKE